VLSELSGQDKAPDRTERDTTYLTASLIFHSLFSTLEALTKPVIAARSDTASQ